MGVLLVAAWVAVHGLDNQPILINPAQVTNLRPPRSADHFGRGAACLLFLTDGRYVAVLERCSDLQAKLQP